MATDKRGERRNVGWLLLGTLLGVASCASANDEGGSASFAASRGTSGSLATQAGLSFETYRETVEPIFMKPRAFDVGDAPCVSCHTFQATTPLKLQPLQEDGGRVYWTEAQSRQNFEVVARLVTPGNSNASRLLNKPLAVDAGGVREHTGGKFWASKDDPEWLTIAAWVDAAPSPTSPPPSEPVPDFEFFHQCVQPIFINPIEDAVECAACHSGNGPRSFANAYPESQTYWTEEQSQANYRTIIRLIELGHPEYSRLLHHPLDREAGGDIMHNGGRRWMTKEDPEWQALAAWIRGEATGTSCPPALRF